MSCPWRQRVHGWRARLVHAVRRPVVIWALRHTAHRPVVRVAGLTQEILDRRRLEIGSGQRPTPGYLHVDNDHAASDLHLRADALRLPIPDHWAREMLAVHVLEHIPAQVLDATLSEWRRVIEPGGVLEVHVPNGLVVARQIVQTPTLDQHWRLQSAIFGYWAGPEITDPTDFPGAPDHKLLFTPALLERVLHDAGFNQITDVSGTNPCPHQDAWSRTIPGLCLEMTARN